MKPSEMAATNLTIIDAAVWLEVLPTRGDVTWAEYKLRLALRRLSSSTPRLIGPPLAHRSYLPNLSAPHSFLGETNRSKRRRSVSRCRGAANVMLRVRVDLVSNATTLCAARGVPSIFG